MLWVNELSAMLHDEKSWLWRQSHIALALPDSREMCLQPIYVTSGLTRLLRPTNQHYVTSLPKFKTKNRIKKQTKKVHDSIKIQLIIDIYFTKYVGDWLISLWCLVDIFHIRLWMSRKYNRHDQLWQCHLIILKLNVHVRLHTWYTLCNVCSAPFVMSAPIH